MKYTVTLAGNRELGEDSNYQTKSVRSFTRTKTGTERDQITFKVKVPATYGYGARLWARVSTEVLNRRVSVGNSSVISTSLTTADPTPGTDLVVTPTCKGMTARWSDSRTPARSRGMALRVAQKFSDGKLGPWKNFTGYEPANSIAVSTLESSTAYVIQARATSVLNRSAWTEASEVTTRACAKTVLRVGTYNTQIYRSNPVSWRKYRAARVASQIKDSHLDLVGLQETPAVNGDQLGILMTRLGKGWGIGGITRSGVRFVYKRSAITQLGAPRQYPNDGSTTSTSQAFRLTGQRDVTFVAVDLHVPKNLDQAGRRRQVKAATGLAEAIRHDNVISGSPTIFLGDMYLATSTEKRTAVRAELSRTMSDAEHFRPGRVLDQYNSRNALIKCPSRKTGVKVDGIFVSDTAAVTSWHMPKYGFSRGCFRRGFDSDHNLITANIWLTAR